MDSHGGRPAAGDRAQTAQDFALGIGFFIVAVAFVFAFIPSMLAFTTADPGVKASKQADVASTALLRDLATNDGHPGRLNGTKTAEYFNSSGSEAALRANLSIPKSSFLNVTVRSIDGDHVINATDASGNEVPLAAGREYPDGEPAAEVSRVVSMAEDDSCSPACQLIVKVW